MKTPSDKARPFDPSRPQTLRVDPTPDGWSRWHGVRANGKVRPLFEELESAGTQRRPLFPYGSSCHRVYRQHDHGRNRF